MKVYHGSYIAGKVFMLPLFANKPKHGQKEKRKIIIPKPLLPSLNLQNIFIMTNF
jgi:hypothetical protein